MGIVGALAAAVVLALGGGAHGVVASAARGAGARPSATGREAANKRLAEGQAGRELRSVRVPPWAYPVSESPAPVLDGPLGTRGEPNLVQRWRWFAASGTVSEAARWFRRHPPEGGRLEEEASEGELFRRLWFGVAEPSYRVYGPSVIPNITRLPGHRVGIRLEVQQIWKAPHPAAAMIPPTARVLDVSRQVGRQAPKWQVIRSPRRVRQVARAIDRLPARQPQVIYCPEDARRRSVLVRMFFKPREGGPRLAEAVERMPPYACESMTLKVAGDRRTFGLEGGPAVIESLRR
jgi:hypothetical protein